MANAVRITGLRELERAFKLYGRGMEKGLREAMESAAEPVKQDAQTFARSAIKVGSIDWSSMRVGVTRRTAYVAPAKRRTVGSRRSKFRDVLLPPMESALEQNIPKVEREFDDALKDLARMWSRV